LKGNKTQINHLILNPNRPTKKKSIQTKIQNKPTKTSHQTSTKSKFSTTLNPGPNPLSPPILAPLPILAIPKYLYS
jgi:hypothetical protein